MQWVARRIVDAKVVRLIEKWLTAAVMQQDGRGNWHNLGASQQGTPQGDVAGLDKAVILPIDARTTRGATVYTNDQIAELCTMLPRPIGFASVHPHREDALAELDRAVNDLGLKGLKLAPSMQEFYPAGRKLYPLYEHAAQLGYPHPVARRYELGAWQPHEVRPAHPL